MDLGSNVDIEQHFKDRAGRGGRPGEKEAGWSAQQTRPHIVSVAVPGPPHRLTEIKDDIRRSNPKRLRARR